MVKNEDVAYAFANRGVSSSRTENMYIDGNAIYSYGDHFPIAVRLPNGKYLFNVDGYSSTTAQHKALVRRYLSDHSLIFATTQELKEAISANGGIVVLKREKPIDDVDDLRNAIEQYYKRKGINTLRIRNKLKPFIEEMEKIAILSSV